jgi:hypothetical protein
MMNGTGKRPSQGPAIGHGPADQRTDEEQAQGASDDVNAAFRLRFRRFRLEIKHYACGLITLCLACALRSAPFAASADRGRADVKTVALEAREW